MREEKETNIHNVKIEYHADDYAMFPVQSHRILDCHRNGNLNGLSVMPNCSCLEECLSDLHPFAGEIAVTVHLNLIEGHSVCAPEEIPLLTDARGNLNSAFGNLLLRSFLPGRNAYRNQLKKELRAQIRAVSSRTVAETPLRLDGHAHYHMIPVVFDALMDVIREDHLKVSYIRIPREHLSLYLRHWKQLTDFSPINVVKVMILNLLAAWAERKYSGILSGMEKKLFLGVFFSGRMYYENVELILPDAISLAQKLGQDIEILAHPGGVFEKEDIAQITCEEDVKFLTSDLRNREKSMFMIKTESRTPAGVL